MARRIAVWLALVIACILTTTLYHDGNRKNGVLWSDQEGYYIYLPATFISGFDSTGCVSGCNTIDTPNGPRLFTKYTYGVALLQAPFFLAAHVLSPLLGFPQDGRSVPYVWSVMLAAVFYMLAGISLILSLLRDANYSKVISYTVAVGILLGTNLFYYTFREAGMSHVYSFFLIALIVFASLRIRSSRSWKWQITLAVALAFSVLIRPTNIIAVLIPILWNSNSFSFGSLIKQRWLSVFPIVLVLVFIPQLLYWKMVTGSYIFYSYENEGFTNWNSPHMFDVLLSHQNGWLIYSPILLTAFLGIILMIKRNDKRWIAPMVVLTLATYIFGSWWAWWFGGAYGHRCYVDFLPLLAVPSAVAVQWILESKWLTTIFSLAALLAIHVNLRMCYIYAGMWDGPAWNWGSYIGKLKEVFFLI